MLWDEVDSKAGYKSECFSFHHTLPEIGANTSKVTQSGSLIFRTY